MEKTSEETLGRIQGKQVSNLEQNSTILIQSNNQPGFDKNENSLGQDELQDQVELQLEKREIEMLLEQYSQIIKENEDCQISSQDFGSISPFLLEHSSRFHSRNTTREYTETPISQDTSRSQSNFGNLSQQGNMTFKAGRNSSEDDPQQQNEALHKGMLDDQQRLQFQYTDAVLDLQKTARQILDFQEEIFQSNHIIDKLDKQLQEQQRIILIMEGEINKYQTVVQ